MSHAPTCTDLPHLLQDLTASLRAFEQSFPREDFEKAGYQQQPCITLLTCCDARVPPTMLGDTFNRVFCVENIGNQVNSGAGSVLYGLLHLHTPLMIVAGHSECGAIKAASFDYAAEPPALRQELDTVKGSLQQGCAGIKVDLGAATVNQAQLSELNVDVQVDRLLSQDEIASLVAQKSLQIIGIVVDLHDVYGEGFGKVYTVNVNGEKSIAALQARTDIGGFAAKAKRLSK